MNIRPLIISGALVGAIGIASAQDSTGVNTPVTPTDPLRTTTPALQPAQPMLPTEMQNQYRLENLDPIDRNNLPTNLQNTLNNPTYEGWERSTIYRDRTSGDYIMQMQSADPVPPTGANSLDTQPRVYRFNKNGTAIDNNPFDGDQ